MRTEVRRLVGWLVGWLVSWLVGNEYDRVIYPAIVLSVTLSVAEEARSRTQNQRYVGSRSTALSARANSSTTNYFKINS